MSSNGDDGVSRSFIESVIKSVLPVRAYQTDAFRRAVRGVVFGSVVGGFLTIFRPILEGVLVIFRGSEPGANAATDPYWGIADFIDYFATMAFDAVRVLIETYIEVIMLIPRAVFGSDPGVFTGLLVLVIVVAELVVSLELLRRGLLALAAAVNLDSLTTLVFGGDG